MPMRRRVKRDLGAIAQGAIVQFAGFGPALQSEMLEQRAAQPDTRGAHAGRDLLHCRHCLRVEFFERGIELRAFVPARGGGGFREGAPATGSLLRKVQIGLSEIRIQHLVEIARTGLRLLGAFERGRAFPPTPSSPECRAVRPGAGTGACRPSSWPSSQDRDRGPSIHRQESGSGAEHAEIVNRIGSQSWPKHARTPREPATSSSAGR